MPLRGCPVCARCKINESLLWTKTENQGILCLDCVKERKDNVKNEPETGNDKQDDGQGNSSKSSSKTRMTRSSNTRLNPFAVPKSTVPRGKGRRSYFKRTPVKSPAATATSVTSDYVFYKGSYFQVGDIVSMVDVEGGTYYAQIHGLLTDQYCEKSACVTWLLPSKQSPPPEQGFAPATYIIGPKEDVPRKLSCMEFIMHAPSDYYKDKNTPYPPVYPPATPGCIWTTSKPVQRNPPKEN